MKDTTPEIYQKQFGIYHSKCLEDRLLMVTEMMDYGVNQIKAVLRQWHSHLSEAEL